MPSAGASGSQARAEPSAPSAPVVGTARPSATASTATAVPQGARCAAAGSPKPVSLGRHPSYLRDLVVGPTGLFAIGSDMARSDTRTIYRVAKDGSSVTTLAKLRDVRYAAHLGLDGRAVYVSQQLSGKSVDGDALLRVSIDGGTLETVAEHFGWLGGVDQGFAYGLDASVKTGSEAVVRVPTSGGEVQVLLRRKLQRVGYHGGPFRFTDLGVDRDGVYLTDAGEGRIAHLPLAGGTPETLLGDALSPCCLHLTGRRVFFGASYGYGTWGSVPKSGGRPADFDWRGPQSDAGGAWAVAPDGDRAIALGVDTHGRWRMALLDADNKTIGSAPLKHIDQVHAVADEDCVYYVRVDPSGVSWVDAVAKPSG